MRTSRCLIVVAVALALAAPQAWAAGSRAPGTTGLRIGMVGFAGDASAKTARVFERYLGQGLSRPVRVVVYPSYNEIIHELLNENLEFAVLSPVVYLNVLDTMRVHTLAYTVFISGIFSYRALILARRDGPVKRLSDLQGRKVAFVDRLSASGYILPRMMLTNAGLRGRRDVKAQFMKNHVDAVRALQAGKVDAACTYDTLFREVEGLKARLADFRIVATSDPIPPDAFVALPKVDPVLRARVRDLLLDYHTAQRKDPQWRTSLCTGWIPADPNLYDGLKKLYADLTRR